MPRHAPGTSFRALHKPGEPFSLINVWDKGSAHLMAAKGAQVLATSFGAHAFTLGRADLGGITRDEALAHAVDLVSATNLPVSGDFENGFGDSPDACAETVRLSAEAGLAGISIEDIALPSDKPYAFELAVERIRAAASAARALPRDFVLVARADGVMHGTYEIEEALKRIRAFDAVGADCLYVPQPGSVENLARICAATTKPINALAAGMFSTLTRAEFAALGVARISLGAALARTTHGLLIDTAERMLDYGDFSPLQNIAPASVTDNLLSEGAAKPK